MRYVHYVVLVAVATAGCAGMSSKVPNETVAAMAQVPEEAGKLPVGQVLSMEKIWFQRDRPPPKPAYVSPQGAAIAAAVVPIFESIRNADWFYRHSLRMKTGEIVSVDLKYEFKVGDCVAFRAGLQEGTALQNRAAIPALKGECDGLTLPSTRPPTAAREVTR